MTFIHLMIVYKSLLSFGDFRGIPEICLEIPKILDYPHPRPRFFGILIVPVPEVPLEFLKGLFPSPPHPRWDGQSSGISGDRGMDWPVYFLRCATFPFDPK